MTSITLREFGGNSAKPEWEHKTTINFLQKKFIRRVNPPQSQSSVFELKFSKNAWENFSFALLINTQFVSATSNATSTSVGQE